MKTFAKLYSACVIILLSLSCYQTSFAQDCDECSRPSIIYYDCEVSIDQSEDSHIFYWPFAMAINNLVNNNSSCVMWGSSAIADIKFLEQGLSNIDPQSLNYAPEGGDNSWDYVIRSVVTSSEGFYTFIIYLETSPTRELVETFSTSFAKDLQSAKDAGLSIVSLINPIIEIIQTFERNKRNNSTWDAIANRKSQNEGKITVTPQKTVVESGETIDVYINVLDCDGVPLGNRIIDFYPTTISNQTGSLELSYGTEGGTIIPAQATTDESGNVTVQFKAGSEQGPAKIIVWYPHFTPPGLPHALCGTALVNIGPPPGDLFILRGSVSYSYSSFSDTSYTVEGVPWEISSSTFAKEEANGRVIAIIENLAADPSIEGFYYYSDVEPLSLIVSGSGMMIQFSKGKEIIEGKLVDSDTRTDNASGSVRPGASIYFSYTDDEKSAEVGVNIKATGQYTIRDYDPLDGWSDYNGDINDYNISAIAGASTDNGCSITKSDSTRYNANYSFSESSELDLKPTLHRTINKSMTLSIDPYDGLTGVSEDEHAQLFPTEFSLRQNYPNPFNPVTNITYQLKNRQTVKLKIFDILGKEIVTLVDGISPQGTFTISWDASNVPGGVYFYRLQAGKFIQTKKMILLK